MRQLQFIRSIKIFQPSVSLKSDIANVIKADSVKDAESLVHHKSLETAEFQALGNPPSIMSVNVPPSVPVYIRRGSLLSIYGTNASSSTSISSNLEILNPVMRFFYGGYSSCYQKLQATTPFSTLISSMSRSYSLFKRSDNKSFATLILDGSSDWAILGKDSLQVFAGNVLNVSMYKLPKKISKNLSKALESSSNNSTGLSKWSHSGYTFVSGRGQVGLTGYGSLYNINLQQDEEVLLNRNNLVAVSVNGPYDLQNCVIKHSFPSLPNETESSKETEEIKDPQANKVTQYWNSIIYYSRSLLSLTRRVKNSTFNTYLGNQEFVKVIGPRNLLLQSNITNTNTFVAKEVPVSYSSSKMNEEEAKAPSLSYVTIQPGKGAVFESTPDFSETVKKIENK